MLYHFAIKPRHNLKLNDMNFRLMGVLSNKQISSHIMIDSHFSRAVSAAMDRVVDQSIVCEGE